MITQNLLELLSDKCEVIHRMFTDTDLLTVFRPTTDNAQSKQVERLCSAVQLWMYSEK